MYQQEKQIDEWKILAMCITLKLIDPTIPLLKRLEQLSVLLSIKYKLHQGLLH